MTGDVSLAPIALFLIIFVWTPPHFWALSLDRCHDYARVGVPMLPVAGAEKTRRILAYALALLPVSLPPWWLVGERLYALAACSAPASCSSPSGCGAIAPRAPHCAPSAIRSSICSACSWRSCSTRRRIPGGRHGDGARPGTGRAAHQEHRAGLILAALAALFYLITIVKMSGGEHESGPPSGPRR